MQQPRDFSLYGAVDLGARQAAAQRSQQAAVRSGGQGGSPDGNVTNVIDVTGDVEKAARHGGRNDRDSAGRRGLPTG